MEDDKTMKIEEALQHSLWSRNVEIGRLRETPFKIMFGRTPVYPGITEGNLITDNSIESLVRLAYLVLLYFASIDRSKMTKDKCKKHQLDVLTSINPLTTQLFMC